MSSPELPRPDENPFQPPQQRSKFTLPTAPDDPERRRRRRIMLTLVGLVLVPVATLIGGFVGCFAGLAAMQGAVEEAWFTLWVSAIAIGALIGGGLTVYFLVLAAKRP
jgi:hypothetical protein